MIKLAVIGSRTFDNFNLALSCFQTLQSSFDITTIVSGGARGADAIGKQIADYYNLVYKEFLPKWDVYGKSAGFKRNIDIINESDLVLAFWDGESKGTAHSLSVAKKLKKLTLICYF